MIRQVQNKVEKGNTMTILEQLRERKNRVEKLQDNIDNSPMLLQSYDLALENALLKLKNRAVEIKDLKHRI